MGPCSSGRWVRPRGVQGRLFSSEQGVLGQKQMPREKTETKWASLVPWAQLERERPSALMAVSRGHTSTLGTLPPAPKEGCRPPEAGALPPYEQGLSAARPPPAAASWGAAAHWQF